jgi:hypothetical protein
VRRETIPPIGKVSGRAWCDGQGGHASYATVRLVMDKPLLWGWGAKLPRRDVNACPDCVERLARTAEARGAKVVRREPLS